MSLIIREAEIGDVYRLARNLRDGDRLEVAGYGVAPNIAIRASFRNALYRRVAVIDGEVAAMWGVGGAAFGCTGYPWLMTAPPVERVPVLFIRVARWELGRMRRMYHRLTGQVAAEYTMACRFLDVLGFTLGPPTEFGPRRAKFCMFTMEG